MTGVATRSNPERVYRIGIYGIKISVCGYCQLSTEWTSTRVSNVDLCIPDAISFERHGKYDKPIILSVISCTLSFIAQILTTGLSVSQTSTSPWLFRSAVNVPSLNVSISLFQSYCLFLFFFFFWEEGNALKPATYFWILIITWIPYITSPSIYYVTILSEGRGPRADMVQTGHHIFETPDTT